MTTAFIVGFASGMLTISLLAFINGCLLAGYDQDHVYMEQRPSR